MITGLFLRKVLERCQAIAARSQAESTYKQLVDLLFGELTVWSPREIFTLGRVSSGLQTVTGSVGWGNKAWGGVGRRGVAWWQ